MIFLDCRKAVETVSEIQVKCNYKNVQKTKTLIFYERKASVTEGNTTINISTDNIYPYNGYRNKKLVIELQSKCSTHSTLSICRNYNIHTVHNTYYIVTFSGKTVHFEN